MQKKAAQQIHANNINVWHMYSTFSIRRTAENVKQKTHSTNKQYIDAWTLGSNQT